MLPDLITNGSRGCRKQAHHASKLFDNRNDATTEFGKRYQDYWANQKVNQAVDQPLVIDTQPTANASSTTSTTSAASITSYTSRSTTSTSASSFSCARLEDIHLVLDNKQYGRKECFDPIEHRDWAQVKKYLAEHLSPQYNISKAGDSSYSISRDPHLSSALSDNNKPDGWCKWIEVLNDYTGSTKLDDVASVGNYLALAIELAGGNRSSSRSKYTYDLQKIYSNTKKSMELSKLKKVLILISHDNKIYFEVLKNVEDQFVRQSYVVLTCPTSPLQLQQFVKDMILAFACVRDLVSFAKTIRK